MLRNAVRALRWRGRRIMRRVLYSYAGIRMQRSVVTRNFPRVGRIDFGDFGRTKPISASFGYDRGTPVDRYYIEQFLAEHAATIRGDVLEIGHATYTRRFGSDVRRSDVLHVDAGDPHATIVADLADAEHVEGERFDAIICTQTLHLIYDLDAAVRTLHRLLRPGGVLLLTVPGISNIDPGEWSSIWCWSLTTVSARRLIAGHFGDDIDVRSFGNVLAAISFLHGLAVGDLDPAQLAVNDPAYPVVIAVRATRPANLDGGA